MIDNFRKLVTEALESNLISARIGTVRAVVLERVAMGGGATNWFVCNNRQDLKIVSDQLLPGSVVSFYFDDQIVRKEYTESARDSILATVRDTRDCVVGILDDAPTLTVEFVAGSEELAELEDDLTKAQWIYFGAFPGRDNDGNAAITITLPDRDGVVRPHPH